MSHSVNLLGMLEDLLLLEHVAFGSNQFCESNGFTSFEETGYMQPMSPRTLMKGLVCEKLIAVAVKGRILLDLVNNNDKAALKRIERQAVIGLNIAYDTVGSKKLSIRDSFNKIIHALQVSMSYAETEEGLGNTHFWDGQVHLVGKHDRKEWSYQLVVAEWTKAVRRMITQFIQEDHLFMLGWDGGL